MKILVLDNKVVAKAREITLVENGYNVDNLYIVGVSKDESGAFVGLDNYSILEVTRWPEDYVDGKYNYIEGQYVVSQEYLERKEAIEQEAIDAYTLKLMEDGML